MTSNYTPLQGNLKPQFKKSHTKTIFAVLIVVAVLIGGGVFLFHSGVGRGSVQGEATTKDQEIKRLTDKVGKHILLPEGEKPTVATVLDQDKLRSQAFFKNVQNGDQIIIYARAQKILIYRPTIDKLLDVGIFNPRQ